FASDSVGLVALGGLEFAFSRGLARPAEERAKQTRNVIRNRDDALQRLFCYKYKPGWPSNRVLSAGLPHGPQHAQPLAMTDANSDSLRSDNLVRSSLQIS